VAKKPILILPNFLRSLFGKSNEVIFKDQTRNTLVNFNRVTAKDRGINYIVIDTTKYEEDDSVTLEFISEQWIYSDFW